MSMEEGINRRNDNAAKPSSGLGITCLPNDTLIQITDILREEIQGEEKYGREKLDELITQLSGVSRLFRAIVVESVSLWTKITNNYILRNGFKERIARTKNAPLSLELMIHESTEWKQILSIILPYKDRWQTLYAEVFSRSRQIAKTFPSLEFPTLVTAALTFDCEENCSPFFAQWKFPNLKTLKIYNTIPPPGTFGHIVALEIWGLHVEEEFTNAYLKRIPRFLAHLRHLERLLLDLSSLFAAPVALDMFPDIVLASVKNFTLRNSNRENTDWMILAYPIGQLLKCMKLPNVKELNLSLCFVKHESIVNWAMIFSDCPETLSSVTSLSLTTSSPQIHYPFALPFALFLSQFQRVQILEVDVEGFVDTLSLPMFQVSLEHLRKFILKEPKDLPTDWKQDLSKLTPNVDRLDVLVERTSNRHSSVDADAEERRQHAFSMFQPS
ncbi:hypothetical protein ACEPAG_6735 [Sanghuangporus baumii]